MKNLLGLKALSAICLTFCSILFYSLPASVTASEVSVAAAKKGKDETIIDDIPGRRKGGATRGGCANMPGQLIALVPENNLGLTKSAHPQFWFNLPKISQPTLVEFVLQDENKNVVYEKAWKTNGSSKIINVDLNNSAAPISALTVDHPYSWFFSIICQPKNRSKDIVVHGLVQRVEVAPALIQKLSKASPLERVNLYNRAGLWQDAVNTLAQELFHQPNNSQLAAAWTQLLQSEKLDMPVYTNGASPKNRY